MPRVFKTDLKPNNSNPVMAISEIIIDGDDARHLSLVLRCRTGDIVTVCDGAGTDYICHVQETLKDQVILRVDHSKPSERKALIRITLYQSIPKISQMEDVIRHAIELGVSRIVPVITERTQVKSLRRSTQATRWQKIAYSAACQSDRDIVPEICAGVSFARLIKEVHLPKLIVAYENERKNTIHDALAGYDGEELGVLIGSEGGFAEPEIEALRERGAEIVTLGRHILRVETAVCAALALINDIVDR